LRLLLQLLVLLFSQPFLPFGVPSLLFFERLVVQLIVLAKELHRWIAMFNYEVLIDNSL